MFDPHYASTLVFLIDNDHYRFFVSTLLSFLSLTCADLVVIGNIVIIGLLAAAVVGYSAFQQKQGKTIASKKTI